MCVYILCIYNIFVTHNIYCLWFLSKKNAFESQGRSQMAEMLPNITIIIHSYYLKAYQ